MAWTRSLPRERRPELDLQIWPIEGKSKSQELSMRRLRTFEVLELTGRICLEHALIALPDCRGESRFCKAL